MTVLCAFIALAAMSARADMYTMHTATSTVGNLAWRSVGLKFNVNSSIGVKLVDLGSTNGTIVNGHSIRKHTLQDNDKITVGDCSIEFVAGDGDRSWYFDVDPTVTLEPNIVGKPSTIPGSGIDFDSVDATNTVISPWRNDGF